jgi:DNA-binding HxlR family transcriptional regulator
MQVTSSGKPKKIGKTKQIEADPNLKSKAHDFPRSPCAVACTLDLVGDKWSLLVVRDLLRGNVTYGELQNSPERIPTNILADRLKRLEKAGLISKSAYQDHPVRYAYELTDKGKSLREVIRAIVRWGLEQIPGTLVLGNPPQHPVHGGKSTGKRDGKS